MRRVALVADTHVPSRAATVPQELLQRLTRYEPHTILHAGDVLQPMVLEQLEAIAPTHAVEGNNDEMELPAEFSETFGQVTVAVRHRPDTADLDAFADRHSADIIVHGHTHQPIIAEEDGYTRINPGSPTVPSGGDPSYVVVNIEETQFDADIQRLQKEQNH